MRWPSSREKQATYPSEKKMSRHRPWIFFLVLTCLSAGLCSLTHPTKKKLGIVNFCLLTSCCQKDKSSPRFCLSCQELKHQLLLTLHEISDLKFSLFICNYECLCPFIDNYSLLYFVHSFNFLRVIQLCYWHYIIYINGMSTCQIILCQEVRKLYGF